MSQFQCVELKAPALAVEANGAGAVNEARVSASRDIRVAAKRLADLVQDESTEVGLIARKWKVGDYGLKQIRQLVAEYLRDRGYKGRVTAITAHGAKGLEYDQVLLLDDGSFPLEHPARPIVEALIPKDEHLREETCLKYVAGTRARRRLDVIDMR